MDVFSSALKNPLPPLRRKLDHSKSEPSNDHVLPDSDSRSEPIPVRPSTYIEAMPPRSSRYTLEQELIDNRKKNSRRRHRNSHLGCGICKKRRIKCDEHLPECHNCVKGRLHCAYLNLDASARNALRLAQYNQNLRDDRSEDALPNTSKTEAPSGHVQKSRYQAPIYAQKGQEQGQGQGRSQEQGQVQGQGQGEVQGQGQGQGQRNAPSVYAHNRTGPKTKGKLSQHSRSQPLANATQPISSMGIPAHGPPPMMSPMYLPVMQLQPMNPGIPYTQLPMQMIAGQHAPPSLLYPHERTQMPIPHMAMAQNPQMSAPSMIYHQQSTHEPQNPYEPQATINSVSASPSGAYMVPMQRQYGLTHQAFTDGHLHPPQPVDPHRPDIVMPAPKSTSTSPRASNSRLNVPHPTQSLVTSSDKFVKSASTQSLPSLNLPSSHLSATRGPKDFDLPPVNSLSNSTSLGTSPLQPTLTSITQSKSGEAIASYTPLKLAPIKIEADNVVRVANEPHHTTKDTEKISSIKMLLS